MAEIINLEDFRAHTEAMKPHVQACKDFLIVQTDDAWARLCHYIAQDIERRHKAKFPQSES